MTVQNAFRLAAVLAALLPVAAFAQAQSARKPNILVIMGDDKPPDVTRASTIGATWGVGRRTSIASPVFTSEPFRRGLARPVVVYPSNSTGLLLHTTVRTDTAVPLRQTGLDGFGERPLVAEDTHPVQSWLTHTSGSLPSSPRDSHHR
jgi:hypothetical protein